MSAAQGADATSIRIVPMEVLVLGFCRTGTACALKLKTHRYVPLRITGLIVVPAMRAALSVLGYGNAHHIGLVMANPAEMDSWTAAINAKFRDGTPYGQKEWDALLGEFKVWRTSQKTSFVSLNTAHDTSRSSLTFQEFYSRPN
jgi:hypothetical protein